MDGGGRTAAPAPAVEFVPMPGGDPADSMIDLRPPGGPAADGRPAPMPPAGPPSSTAAPAHVVDAALPEPGASSRSAPGGVPVAGHWVTDPVRTRTRLSRGILVTAAAAVLALLAGSIASVALGFAANARTGSGEDLSAAAAEASGTLRAADGVHAGVLGLAAAAQSDGAGSGPSMGEVRTRLGELRAATAPELPSGVDLDRRVAAAERARAAYTEQVSAALDRAEADPDAVVGGLDALERRHENVVTEWTALVRDLGRAAQDRADAARGLRWAAALVLVPAVLLSGAVLFGLHRRLRRDLDEPVDRVRAMAAQLAGGDLDARSGVAGSTDVAALGEDVDAAAESLHQHVRRLRLQAEWGAQSRMIFEALDLVDDESEAHEVARQALALIDGERSVELLLAPHGSTELTAVAANPNAPRPGCPVDETGGCVAIRRAQVVVFDSSESINACPKLRNRPTGPCSAACVPLSVAGRPVGVLHTVSADRHPPDDRVVSQLATLSTQLGNRLGALRALESSRHEAATDKLTGLPNRRLLESQIATLIERSTPFVLVLADLDKFKNLNDSYGHEVGDRALQLFAQVLRDKVRGNDVIARLGGEEFVLVYPNMSVTTSIEAIERIRDGLANTLAVSRLPEFTCSFGITHSAVGRSGDAILRVADAGLLRAKELGGDQVVYADETLAARMFSDDDPQPGRPATR